MDEAILHGLNAEQRAVVADLDHHILLNAPAGTGKPTCWPAASPLSSSRDEPKELRFSA